MDPDWRPTADLDVMRARAALLSAVRQFFAEREVLEVETPLLCAAPVTDPSVQVLTAASRYLQTSPEYAMKRLLAAGSGPIFQICKAFRGAEAGSRHNPEFSMLEWYRPGFASTDLMQEVEDLLRPLLPGWSWERISYRQLFLDHLGVEPHQASLEQLQHLAALHVETNFVSADRDDWLSLLMTHVIEPRLSATTLLVVYDYPASQCALARLCERDGIVVSDRFEVYGGGLELANAYCELADPEELLRRFQKDLQHPALSSAQRPIDQRLLAALEAGLPDCSGIALGLDRLLMLQLEMDDIDKVLTFPWAQA
ncbi:EF-P lysine aminoacylase GenX [Halieaceae bacterium IMCC14734]|uniref:EF-P lysine aminoacylase GenX n=1 Tax=Candidatus Litorirhabdus singularis TaxID=2518993 RepID=A0ABT3TCB2_9GAMM|nr:EF-P lysine aminoacylase EpmA [Candidatus Litorirhabdus singularis]MCX2979815.1 EF-P lysine aminoacylase GenX [Candidatus Litorirhabdus singularis]